MRGLGYNSNVNHTSSIQKTKNVFVNTNGKTITQASHKDKEKMSSQGPSQRSYGAKRKENTFKGKVPLKKIRYLRNQNLNHIPMPRQHGISFKPIRLLPLKDFKKNVSTSRKSKW